MQGVVFYLILPFIYLLSLLPLRILYLLSDLTCFLLFSIFKYRRDVVAKNMQNSFPEKSLEEITVIEKKFYRHLCDLIFESLKSFTISSKEAIKRCRIDESSIALLNKLYDEKKSLVLVMGHYGNWEWGGLSFSLQIRHQLFFIYKPLSNKYFDKLMYDMRSKFGAKLISMNSAFKEMVNNKHTVNATAFIADQTPFPENAYWTTFLNQDTPVFTGTEKIAKKLNYPVIFINIRSLRRGYYELSAEMLIDEPKNTNDGEISDIHTQRLEKEIRIVPQFWLWSHKRWKHKRK